MHKEEAMYCDMHTHSVFSDGTDTPTQLIRKAEQANLYAVALTDHNSVSGLPEFVEAAKNSSVEAIPGIEFSTEHNGKELHVVGLFIKEKDYEKVRERCDSVLKSKENSNRLLIENLKNAGYDVNYEELQEFAATDNINRAVIAGYLMKKGIIKDRREGFVTLLSEHGGYYVPARRPSTLETITFIKSIGAVAVLAHPFLDLSPEEARAFLPEAKKCGLDAMETSYSLYDEKTQRMAEELATENGLLFSGGSDYHGDAKPLINLGTGKGNLKIPMEYYLKLSERASK